MNDLRSGGSKDLSDETCEKGSSDIFDWDALDAHDACIVDTNVCDKGDVSMTLSSSACEKGEKRQT